MAAPKTIPEVDAFLRNAETWRAEFEALRAIVLDCGLTEEVKWGWPCYALNKRKSAQRTVREGEGPLVRTKARRRERSPVGEGEGPSVRATARP